MNKMKCLLSFLVTLFMLPVSCQGKVEKGNEEESNEDENGNQLVDIDGK